LGNCREAHEFAANLILPSYRQKKENPKTMVDLNSIPQSLTIHLPAELVAELQKLAQEKVVSVDEVVRDACLMYTEPYIWERCYKQWLRAHPGEAPTEYGIDGDNLGPPKGEATAP